MDFVTTHDRSRWSPAGALIEPPGSPKFPLLVAPRSDHLPPSAGDRVCYKVARFDPARDYGIAEDAPAYDAGDAPTFPEAPLGDEVLQRGVEGHLLRVAAALIQGTRSTLSDREAGTRRLRSMVDEATGNETATPGADEPLADDATIAARLKLLARSEDRQLAELLRLLVRFDKSGAYRADGCRSLLVWMDLHLGIGRSAGFDRLRVAHALTDLPVLESLFALGQVSFSKLREITRYARPATEAEFAVATLALSVTETIEYCRRFRHVADRDEDAANSALVGEKVAEARAALRAFGRRSLKIRSIDEHSKRITLDLPTDLAAEWLASLELVEDCVRDGNTDAVSHDRANNSSSTECRPTAQQIRADAAVLMSRRSLSLAGDAVAMADRYRVHVNMNVRSLSDEPITVDGDLPIERPWMQGQGPLSRTTARRLAEEAGFTLVAVDDAGEVVGTKSIAPPFTKRQLRQIHARDRRCQLPGCGATRHLHGHHIVHREYGGQSTLANAAATCSSCHRLLHEGGFRLERTSLTAADLESHAVKLGIDDTGIARARAKLVRVRRFRLLDAQGLELPDVGAAWAQRTADGREGERECARDDRTPPSTDTESSVVQSARADSRSACGRTDGLPLPPVPQRAAPT